MTRLRAEDLIIEDAISPNILKRLRGGSEGLARVMRSSHADIGSARAPHGMRTPYENHITVAKQGGDFDDPVDALIAIEDNSALNRYCIDVKPGIYNPSQPIVMKPYVALVGMDRDVCIIQSADYDSLVVMDDHSTLNEIQVINTRVPSVGVDIAGIYALSKTDILIDSVIAKVNTDTPEVAAALFADAVTAHRVLGTELYAKNIEPTGTTYAARIISDVGPSDADFRYCYFDIEDGTLAEAVGVLVYGLHDQAIAKILGSRIIVENLNNVHSGVRVSGWYDSFARIVATDIEHRNTAGGGYDIEVVGTSVAAYVRAVQYSTWRPPPVGGPIIPLPGDSNVFVAGAPFDVTISGGAITILEGISSYRVDTEGGAAIDDLTDINGGLEGQVIFLRSAVNARNVVIRDAVGAVGTLINCGADFTLGTVQDEIMLRKRSDGPVQGWDCVSLKTN